MQGQTERCEAVINMILSDEEAAEMKAELVTAVAQQRSSGSPTGQEVEQGQPTVAWGCCYACSATVRAWLVAIGVCGIFQMATGVEASTYYMPVGAMPCKTRTIAQ